MTDEELDRLVEKMKDCGFVPQKTKEKPRRKGLFSKVLVIVYTLIIAGYTAGCLFMQWKTGAQPEPQLTISLFALAGTELASLAAIKRGKQKGE